ncbi:carboxypeptidase-like regulatory domain-containing protein [Candidatus Entotheonella palauensis]|uniref:carboxypeptidase-like regulatory domain-containing protein n=1 Tax=Candidatus Entotheonella palauensis TaxID=93172 RepID=UPI000B7D7167|nr:carboxypeptidase-like regulatory domain-containing protein [Candidatus Entotheonella palauensis]
MPHMLLALLCLFFIAPDAVRSATSGRIEGVVHQEGKAIANHRIMLIRFGPGQEVNRTPGETDAEGGFAFEGLETGDDFTYFVGIRYEGKLFRSESLQLSDNETKQDVVIKVGSAGTPALVPGAQLAQINIPHHIIAIVLREGRLDVREIVNIQNSGSVPYQGEAQRKYVLHLPLPKGYDNLRDIQGIAPEHIRSDPFGLYLTQPLAPGTHRLVYTYALPMDDRVRTLLLRRSLPTRMIDVFTDAKSLVATSDFQFLGEVPIQSHTFLHFRGTNPEPGARNWVQITLSGTSTSSALQVVSYALIVAIALMGLAIPLYNQWRHRAGLNTDPAPGTEQIQAWQSERSQLLLAIAQLDNAQAAGALDDIVYRQRRQSCKQQLRRVAEELHRANQPLDTPSLVQELR